MIEFLIEIKLNSRITEIDNIFIKKPEIELHYNEPDYEFIVWGDPICDEDFKKRLESDKTAEFFLNNLYSHYYYIFLNKLTGDLIIGNSLFGILPVYYYTDNKRIVLSENALTLGKYLDKDLVSKRFILETVLFNYPLFNNSIIEGINLLPSNSYIKITGTKKDIIKHTNIDDFFSTNPKPWKRSTAYITDLFISTVKRYLPDIPYVHALTGGFDSRTLVASGLYYKKDFSCYSFGSDVSKDVQVASELAVKASLNFINICLDDNYATASSLSSGKEFVFNSSGSATFARAHYLHAAKILAKDYSYIITGNFGSEIFRAAHVAGAVISSNLYSLFNSENADEGIKKIESSVEYNSLNMVNYSAELKELKADIQRLQCYDDSYSGLTKNQRFYVFVFEELFRKYFGAEMINQFHYIKNRTPFLDIDFLKAIMQTGLAGIYSDFFEHNPFKRYKGQVLYAHIIRKTYPEFGKMITDKGYKPDDLLSFFGKLNIVGGYLKKITRKPAHYFDLYSVNRSWEHNRDYWLSIPVLDEYFNKESLLSLNMELLFKVISLSYLLKLS